MPFFRIVDCQTFFAEYFCHMVVLLNIILRNGKLPNGKIAEGCCGMTYTPFFALEIITRVVHALNDLLTSFDLRSNIFRVSVVITYSHKP